MKPEFEEVFALLKTMMKKHERTLKVLTDEPQEYTLATKSHSNRGQPMWFGSVRAGRAYVSYHRMALYFNPAMKALVAPALTKRMQGKTWFNFKSVDKELFGEWKKLTPEGADSCRTGELR
jgi:hypothetical protein